MSRRDSQPTSSTSASLLAHIIQSGIPDGVLAAHVLRAVLGTLGQRLLDDEAAALVAHLPPTLARIVEQREHDGDFSAEEFYARVHGALANTTLGAAREHTNVVLQVLGRLLSEAVRGRLVRALPAEIGRNLVPPTFGEPPPHGPRAPAAKPLTTLASGRPGSLHPLAESAPPSGHAHSVAVNPDPHGDTKLSSARGLTQERVAESLASGRPPGPARSVADATDESRSGRSPALGSER